MKLTHPPLSIYMFILLLTTAAAPCWADPPHESISRSATRVSRSETTTELSLSYQQTREAWKTASLWKHARGDIDTLTDALRHKYGEPEESFVKIFAQVESPLEDRSPWSFIARPQAEVLMSGLVQNPGNPELHAQGLALGSLGVGIGWIGPETKIKWRALGIGGIGYERRIDTLGSQLVNSGLPVREGKVSVWGGEISATRTFGFGESDAVFTPSGMIRPLKFSTQTPSAGSLQTDLTSPWSVRWQTRVKSSHPLDALGLPEARGGLHWILGPQPLPVDLLPLGWDYIHRPSASPEVGALLGCGLDFAQELTPNSSLQGDAGYYGGYWGGRLGLLWGPSETSLSTWGVETSPAFHGQGERLWSAAFTLRF